MSRSTHHDLLFEALADGHRRRLCAYLADRDGTVELADVCATLCERSQCSRRTLEIELHHVHLPLLADAGIIDYARGADRIEPAGNLPVAKTILETTAEATCT
ncbi:DUF7344 domain-containing protein [Halopiger aswanensis]|uniref:DUF7344 domain-containing protein n=1 Tax=Halopiger aswanensis TaxID=148449 RepID=A0A419WH92_9EURY|nr:helix-turn-helix transcriptional regulator [Halopiger aswanensis]RKD94911.1 hypothetical protein ATJ93_1755 [Halopiger aswanensis]